MSLQLYRMVFERHDGAQFSCLNLTTQPRHYRQTFANIRQPAISESAVLNMGRISLENRTKIVQWHEAGRSIVEIVKLMGDQGAVTSRNAVGLFLKRYKKTGAITDGKKSGRLRKATNDVKAYIEEKMNADRELTSRHLQENIQAQFGVQMHERTVRAARTEMGWVRSRTRYGHMVRAPN